MKGILKLTCILFLMLCGISVQAPITYGELTGTTTPSHVLAGGTYGAALGVFGGVVAVVVLLRSKRVRDRIRRWRAAAVEWIDAV